MPLVIQQEEEKPKTETGKAIERERDAAIKRKTLALDERMNDFKEMLRERGVRKIRLYYQGPHSAGGEGVVKGGVPLWLKMVYNITISVCN